MPANSRWDLIQDLKGYCSQFVSGTVSGLSIPASDVRTPTPGLSHPISGAHPPPATRGRPSCLPCQRPLMGALPQTNFTIVWS